MGLRMEIEILTTKTPSADTIATVNATIDAANIQADAAIRAAEIQLDAALTGASIAFLAAIIAYLAAARQVRNSEKQHNYKIESYRTLIEGMCRRLEKSIGVDIDRREGKSKTRRIDYIPGEPLITSKYIIPNEFSQDKWESHSILGGEIMSLIHIVNEKVTSINKLHIIADKKSVLNDGYFPSPTRSVFIKNDPKLLINERDEAFKHYIKYLKRARSAINKLLKKIEETKEHERKIINLFRNQKGEL